MSGTELANCDAARRLVRLAMDYDGLAKLAEVQLADQEAIGRKT
jgi:hypothetical protein